MSEILFYGLADDFVRYVAVVFGGPLVGSALHSGAAEFLSAVVLKAVVFAAFQRERSGSSVAAVAAGSILSAAAGTILGWLLVLPWIGPLGALLVGGAVYLLAKEAEPEVRDRWPILRRPVQLAVVCGALAFASVFAGRIAWATGNQNGPLAWGFWISKALCIACAWLPWAAYAILLEYRAAVVLMSPADRVRTFRAALAATVALSLAVSVAGAVHALPEALRVSQFSPVCW